MRLMIAASCAALMGIAATATEAAPPVTAFGSLPAITRPAISADGKYLAAIEPLDGRAKVAIFTIGDGSKPRVFDAPDAEPLSIQWANSDRLIIYYGLKRTDSESTGLHLRQYSRAISISVSGKDLAVMMKNSRLSQINYGFAPVDGMDPKNPDSKFMAAWDWSGAVPTDSRFKEAAAIYNLYIVDVDTGKPSIVERGVGDTRDWIVGTDGDAVARLDANENLKYKLFVRPEGTWRQALEFDGSGGVENEFVGLTSQGDAIATLRFGPHNTLGLDSFGIKSMQFGAPLYRNESYDISSVISDPWTGRVIGVRYDSDKPEAVYFDDKLTSVQKSLAKAFPGEIVQLVTWSRDRNYFLVSTESSREPRIYNLFTSATGQFQALASEYPSLQPADLGEMKSYPYPSRDKLTIPAYLTLPPGKVAKNLPVVVFPHGGPESRDSLGFDWWAQFMASRGYAVLQPNFRGSSGYGASFRDAGLNQWGKKMQDDISDGVIKLIADGIADPKRICIVGASYGGYAALAGATFSPELYKCAVSYAGISDPAALIGDAIKRYGARSEVAAYWQSRIGNIYSDQKLLAEIAPGKHADNVRAPILLLHCEQDLTVEISQSEIEQKALTDAGKSVKFIRIAGDDHYLNVASTRIQVLTEIEKFLAANIGN